MTSYAEALLNPASRKEIFALFDLRSHVYAWAAAGPADVWVVEILDAEVIGVNLDEAAMGEAASLGAIAVGEFFWDGATEQLYVRTGSSLEPFGSFYVAVLRFKFNRDGEELGGVPYEARVSNVPSVTTKTGETFDGKVGATGAGAISLHNADALLNRVDLEPDGSVTIMAQLETFGDPTALRITLGGPFITIGGEFVTLGSS
jgi:hypothetical protein